MKDKLISIGTGALIAAAGAALTYLSAYVGAHDLGPWTPIVAATLAVAVNAVRKLRPSGE